MCEGDFRGAYILRTLGSSEFKYETAKRHLLNLNLDSLGSRTMHFNTVAEEEADGGAGDQAHAQGHGRLMRLATWINLDSRISVSSNDSHVLTVSDRDRSAVPEQSSAMFNAEGPRITYQTIQIRHLHSGSARSRCSRSPTQCFSTLMLWHLCKSSGLRIIRTT